MHTYTPAPLSGELPSILDYRFNDAYDVVARAEDDGTIGRLTWPEAWHLDVHGEFRCYFKGSTLDSLQGWAEDPGDLLYSREVGLREGGCAPRWVIVDSRPSWMAEFKPVVGEGDASAFLCIRKHLAQVGVVLVDAVVFDDAGHWWSMYELTSGTTRWSDSDGLDSFAAESHDDTQ